MFCTLWGVCSFVKVIPLSEFSVDVGQPTPHITSDVRYTSGGVMALCLDRLKLPLADEGD